MAKLCDSKIVEGKMRKGIDVAKTVEFNCDSHAYLNTIFSSFKSELRKNSKFLEFLECSQISGLFEHFLKESGNYNKTQHLDICGIKGGDILIIKCPSIFASYHFIVVAVNLERTNVSIIQSFGNFLKFNKIDMSFDEFDRQLKMLHSFDNEGKSFDDAYPEMIKVEAVLYGVDDKKYIKHLENHQVSFENSQSNEENSYVERAGALDIPPEIYENLEYQYGINDIRLEIYAYRVKSALKTDLCKESVKVGKKKSKSKTRACRKSRKGRGKSRSGKKSKSRRKRKSGRKSK